jgi:phage tail protein X
MITYRTKDGDVIDWICWKHYGFTSGAVEKVLKINPKVAEFDEHLPEGLLISLPEISKENRAKQVKLWD